MENDLGPSTVAPAKLRPFVVNGEQISPFYEGLRKMAFTATPEQLGLSLSADKTVVYGVIMDWEMSGATATTVSYQTGDASLYLSSGGGVIGGGQHQSVNSAAKQFVSLAQTFLDKTTKTETTPYLS